MAASETLTIIVRARNLAKGAIKGLQGQMKGLQAGALKLKAALATTQGAMASLGIAFGIGAVVKDTISTFARFDDTMRAVGAVAGASAEQLKELTEIAKEMGATTRFTATEAAEGLRFLSMAGFEVEESMAALPGVLNLAAAGAMDLATAADIATNILAAYGLEAERLEDVNNVLVATFTQSNTTLTELGEAFKLVGPIAKGLGADFEDLLATLGTLASSGIRASMAGTSLRGALSALFNPTREETELMGELAARMGETGLQIKDAEGKFVGFTSVIRQLEKAGVSGDEALKLFGQRAGPAMAALLGQGADALEEFTGKLKDPGQISQLVAEQMESGLGGALRELRSAMEAVQIQFGEIFGVALRDAIRATRERVIAFLNSLKEAQEAGDFTATIDSLRLIGKLFGLILKIIGLATAELRNIWTIVKGVSKVINFFKGDAEEGADAIGAMGASGEKLHKVIGDAGFEQKKLTSEIIAGKKQIADFEKAAKKTYDTATREATKWAKTVLAFQEKIRFEQMSTEDQVRELRRRTLTETEQFLDRQRQANEKLARARQLAVKGATDAEIREAKRLADEARRIFAGLPSGIPEGIGRGLKDVTEEAVAGVEASSKVITDIYQQGLDNATAMVEKNKELADVAKEQLDTLAERREAQVDIKLENLTEAQNAINDLVRDETKRIKVIIESETRAQHGAHIAGYGGGDKVPAKLERGEFVLRKEAVRKYGSGLFHGFNALKMKLGGIVDTLPTSPRLGYQEGGDVGFTDLGRVEIGVGGESFPVFGQAEVIEALKEQLTRENLIRSN